MRSIRQFTNTPTQLKKARQQVYNREKISVKRLFLLGDIPADDRNAKCKFYNKFIYYEFIYFASSFVTNNQGSILNVYFPG